MISCFIVVFDGRETQWRTVAILVGCSTG